MSEYVVTWEPGQKLPNGEPADELYMVVEAVDEVDAHHRLWDLHLDQYGEVFGVDQAKDAMKGRREVIAEQWLIVERCHTCRARVIRAMKVSNLATTSVDAASDPGGTVTLVRTSARAMPLARTLSVAARFGRTNLRTIHSCKARRAREVHA